MVPKAVKPFVGLVNNLQSYAYWSGAEYSPGSGNAWGFYTYGGSQNYYSYDVQLYAWAVQPGDVFAVTPVPEPSIVWLLGSGLGLLAFTRRWKNQNIQPQYC